MFRVGIKCSLCGFYKKAGDFAAFTISMRAFSDEECSNCHRCDSFLEVKDITPEMIQEEKEYASIRKDLLIKEHESAISSGKGSTEFTAREVAGLFLMSEHNSREINATSPFWQDVVYLMHVCERKEREEKEYGGKEEHGQ